jgi:hypothetical protein
MNQTIWKKCSQLTLAAGLALALLVAGCSLSTYSGGSGGEAGNPVVMGVVVDPSGNPVSHVKISVLNSRYNPVEGNGVADSMTDTTDSEGFFKIKVHENDTFTIQANHLSLRLSALMTGIATRDRSIPVPDIVVHNPGAIRVLLAGGSYSTNGYVYIPGTTIFSQLNNIDSVIIDPVPAGTIPSLYYAVMNSPAAPQLIKDSIVVIPGRTTTVSYYSWKYSRKLLLNTTGSGAGVGGNVTGFPVLVRLTSTNFDFSLARKNGDDIRFAKSDNTPLPYEIEHWDSSSAVAEIWVRIDTVYGNNNSQYATMLFGNASAVSASNSGAVFDTSNGFQGVWHMSQSGKAAEMDATVNHYDGTAVNMLSASPENGIIGNADEFDGSSSYITMPHTASSKLTFPENGFYTVSAWVYSDTLAALDSSGGTNYNVVAAKGVFPYEYILQIKGTQWEMAEFHDKSGWQSSFSPAGAKAWHHVAGVRAGAHQYLYVDGTVADSAITFTSMTGSRDSAAGDLTIGTDRHVPAAYFFKGKIDEVCISSSLRSADWIKLSYMNQNRNDALVSIGK